MKPVFESPGYHLIITICGVLLFSGCGFERMQSEVVANDDIIKAHIDTTITVYDSIAVVRLPIEQGVKIWNPGVLEKGPEGRIFGANLTGEIYSLVDTDGDGLEDKAVEFCNVKDDGFRTPTGLAFKGWDLYVGLPQQVRVYRDTDHDFRADTSFVFFDDIPFSDHPYEYTSGLKFDKNNWLYIALTTDSWNAGASPDPKKYRGSILKISPDGDSVKVMATGIRSVFGMSFNKDDDLYFADNRGGQNAVEELHFLKEGHFYGHNSQKYGNLKETLPIAGLENGVAPAEIEFRKENDKEYLYAAYYGPGEYWRKGSIAKSSITRDGEGEFSVEEKPFVDIPKSTGLAFSDAGDMYVSSVGQTDYWYFAKDSLDGVIYRLIRKPWVEPASPDAAGNETIASESRLERGRFIFNQKACSSCHSTDGKTEMLGPGLKDISSVYSRDELIVEIREPSKRLKPGDFPTKITTKNDEVFLGRVLTQNENEVRIILVGNNIKNIPVAQIKSSERLTESLMWPGLLNGMSEEDKNALLDYLMSL